MQVHPQAIPISQWHDRTTAPELTEYDCCWRISLLPVRCRTANFNYKIRCYTSGGPSLSGLLIWEFWVNPIVKKGSPMWRRSMLIQRVRSEKQVFSWLLWGQCGKRVNCVSMRGIAACKSHCGLLWHPSNTRSSLFLPYQTNTQNDDTLFIPFLLFVLPFCVLLCLFIRPIILSRFIRWSHSLVHKVIWLSGLIRL